MAKLIKVLLTGVLICLLAGAVFAAAKLLSVQVKEGHVRSTPSFLGKIVATVAYTKQVEVLKEKGDWMQVALPKGDTEGWMHSSALTKKKILLNPDAKDIEQAASSDEVALAGKGFNEEVEKKFKEGNSAVNYAAVDKMEKIIVSQEQMEQFLTMGAISPEGGAK